MKNKNYIKKYEDVKKDNDIESNLNESTMPMGDKTRVTVPVDIPNSLVKAYAKKVKDASDRDVFSYFSNTDIAEEIVKYMLADINIDKLPAGFIYGEELEAPVQNQPQAQVQPQEVQEPIQAQPQVQVQPQVEPQAQPQAQDEFGFEDVQSQAQAQEDAQSQAQEEEEVQEEAQEEEGNLDLPI